MPERDSIIGADVMSWLEKRAKALSEAGFENEFTLRETMESSNIIRETKDGPKKGDVVPGLYIYNTGHEAGFDVFVTLIPCETDEDDVFLLSLSHYEQDNEKLRIKGWSFPLLDYPEAFSEADDLKRVFALFEQICSGKEFVHEADSFGEVPEMYYELPRLQALNESLGMLGADPELVFDEGSYPFIRIEDGELWFELSYLMIDEADEAFILRAKLFDRAVKEPVLYFDMPELDGLSEGEGYGRLLEAMEVISYGKGLEGSGQ